MKGILLITSLIFMLSAFGQNPKPQGKRFVTPVKPALKVEQKTLDGSLAKISIFGDFTVYKIVVLNSKHPNKIDLNLLMGSLVRIQKTSVTGDEIDPMTFDIYEVEKMTSEDYIYRVSGVTSDSAQSELPYSVNVHKTDHAECYGILNLGSDRVAIAYHGTLLFLKRR